MAVGRQGARQFQDLFDVIPFTVTVDPASHIDGAGETIAITVTGAALGDLVLLGPGADMLDLLYTASVTAADTVSLRIQNESTVTRDVASSTWNGLVLKPKGNFELD